MLDVFLMTTFALTYGPLVPAWLTLTALLVGAGVVGWFVLGLIVTAAERRQAGGQLT